MGSIFTTHFPFNLIPMYGYANFVPCNREEVLRRISQEEIYLLVLDDLPPPNQYILSPFRKDKKPGAYFTWYNGILYFKDFGDPIRSMRDCFQVVMENMNMTFKECLLFINNHFQLGLDSSKSKPIIFEDIIVNRKVNKSMPGKIKRLNEKPSDEIIYKPRGFFPIDKNYWWERYEISRSQLMEDNTYCAVWFQFYSRKGQLITIRPTDITYAYSDFDDNRTKIYRPLHTDKKGKWNTNCTEDDIGGIRRLAETGDILYITKSYKDYRVLKNLKLHVIWFQNEGMFPNNEMIFKLCTRFSKIIIIYDNDEKGIIAGNNLVLKINAVFPNKAKLKYISERYTNAKDPSDLKHRYGGIELNKFINLK